MRDPKLTIIIPTLRRPDTLYWTLQTALNQEYDNYSILVSDNFSNDHTEQVVRSFKDNRISYVNPGKKLSMSHHWEFALDHVNKGFVTILGDDDGILPQGLNRVVKILQKHSVQAVGWQFGNFNWQGLPSYFKIPMADYYRVVDAKTEIQKIFQKSIYSTIQFPSLYGGFIDIELIRHLKQKFGGSFFHSRIPDFFSGGLIAASVDKYIRAEFPVTINATSKHSTGFATINEKNDQTAFVDLQKKEDNIPFHKDLVFIRSNAIPIAEAMLQVHELVPTFPRVNFKKLLTEVAGEAAVSENYNRFLELMNGVQQLASMNHLDKYGEELVKNTYHEPVKSVVKKKFSPISLSLYVDTTNSGINNIEDACNFAAYVIPGNFFELKNKPARYLSLFSSLYRYLCLKLFSDKRKLL